MAHWPWSGLIADWFGPALESPAAIGELLDWWFKADAERDAMLAERYGNLVEQCGPVLCGSVFPKRVQLPHCGIAAEPRSPPRAAKVSARRPTKAAGPTTLPLRHDSVVTRLLRAHSGRTRRFASPKTDWTATR